jgi:hypothetical protein
MVPVTGTTASTQSATALILDAGEHDRIIQADLARHPHEADGDESVVPDHQWRHSGICEVPANVVAEVVNH